MQWRRTAEEQRTAGQGERTVDHGRFDALTRSAGEGGTRRALLQFLAAGALGGATAWLGTVDGAAAKPTRKSKPKSKRRSQAERQAEGQLQSEGKRKGKKGKNKPKPPQGCRGMFCDDGGRCCNGACEAPGECCRDEKPCGGGCIAATSCCPYDEKECPGGSCAALNACCPDEKSCPGLEDLCISIFECCPDERMCDDGLCVAYGECCQDEHLCDDGWCAPDDECCPGRKPCPDGSCIPADNCCPDDLTPLCGDCHEAVCDDGEYVCRLQSGCCPAGAAVCPGAPEWYWPIQQITLPAGCCPQEKMIAGPACAQPWSGGSAWPCNP
jgi:hypothetical protein